MVLKSKIIFNDPILMEFQSLENIENGYETIVLLTAF